MDLGLKCPYMGIKPRYRLNNDDMRMDGMDGHKMESYILVTTEENPTVSLEGLKILAPYMELSIVLVRLCHGFMTAIYPYIGISRYGLNIDDIRDLHIYA